MIYNSFLFIVLYPIIFLLYYAIPAQYVRARNLYLLLASYALYISWSASHALILMGVTVVTWLTSKMVVKSRRPKTVLTVGILLALFPLLFYKYFNFINDSISQLLGSFGLSVQLAGLNWAIPVGISFFTFQAIGYVFDVYRKKTDVENDFLTYALFVSFFPSILSGPINKASLVIPQLRALRPYLDYSKAVAGMKMLLWGMFMKVVVADRVAIYVDMVLPQYEHFTGTSCFVASILYSIQIYADFGGYSLMAIGVGKTLGFELTENFRRPYFSFSVTDFWRRWHISLSTWLRDYIYIPLGGSRCSKVRNYWNIFVTFLVSGIWHGANWTFIVWGILHGLFQIVEKMLGEQKCRYGALGRTVKTVITFLLINFAWIFFRMPTLADACGVIARIFNFSLSPKVFYGDLQTPMFILIGILLLLLKDIRDEFFPHRMPLMTSRHTVVRWFTYVTLILAILLMGVFSNDQFIYANF
ncbi:MAG: MBOAT family protein [Prevotella sp.]|nr:MBOAT family protein [Prevotella sp.]